MMWVGPEKLGNICNDTIDNFMSEELYFIGDFNTNDDVKNTKGNNSLLKSLNSFLCSNGLKQIITDWNTAYH